MKAIVIKLLEQGLPTLLFLVAVACLGLGFFEIRSVSPFTFVQKIYLPLIVVALLLLSLSVALWFIDRQKPRDAEAAIDGHVVLIRMLLEYSKAHQFRPPDAFASVVAFGNNPNEVAQKAARYGSMYLQSLGLLEPNATGSEVRATKKSVDLLNSDLFRARNSDAFR